MYHLTSTNYWIIKIMSLCHNFFSGNYEFVFLLVQLYFILAAIDSIPSAYIRFFLKSYH
jgi:hypothetical protein